VRFHNIYGRSVPGRAGVKRPRGNLPQGSRSRGWRCDRGVGDGLQTRSFCYIEDCVEGILRIMNSGYPEPLNLGSDEIITINDLVALVAGVAVSECESSTSTDRKACAAHSTTSFAVPFSLGSRRRACATAWR